MKKPLVIALAFAALANAANADERTVYHWDRRHHEMTITTTTLPPSEETVYYSGPSETEKAAARADFCKHFQCAKEYPLGAKIPGQSE